MSTVSEAHSGPLSPVRRALTQATVVLGAFFSALGFAGALHLDGWLAAWAVEPVLMFRVVAHALFFWLPKLDWLSPELATLSLLFYSILARGLVAEGMFTDFRSSYQESGRADRALGVLIMAGIIVGVPPSLLQAIAFLQGLAEGDFTLWTWLSALDALDGFILFGWLSVSTLVFACAPRTFAYVLGFLFLFYGWGLFVSQPPAQTLPVPSNFTAPSE